MRRTTANPLSRLLIAAATAMTATCPVALALAPLPRAESPAAGPVWRIADTGIDIVRMPPPPSASVQPSIIPASPQNPVPAAPQPVAPPQPPPRATPTPAQPAQLGRTLKLQAKVGSSSTDGQKGWLGVRMETVELPLALSLGRQNAAGALIVDTTAGGPAGQAGLRFGDIVTGYNGRAVQTMDDLRLQVEATTPGTYVIVDAWRVATDDGDFVQALRRLGDGGNAYVMHRLGRMYAGGIGVARDESEAVRWYRKGSNAGNPNAMAALGIALLDGRGAAKDPQEAVRLLKAAADKDNHDAIYRVAMLYAHGLKDAQGLNDIVSKDALEAARLLTRAAEAGHSPSMVDLGLLFNNGQGVAVDFNKAAMWYKRAADLGNSYGMVNLGFLQQQGKGVQQDDVAAVNLYRKAANLGNPLGIHNLAAMYDTGRGIERKDPERAATLMLQALELRNQFSHMQMTQPQHSNRWSKPFRMAMQRKLQEAGYYSGRVDGNFRESTVSAINAYVNRNR
jgi:TPR repeat protein